MADAFDPYHKWLGISPKDQPPHHYRLLALELFESDPDVIEGAADQRMAHVRTFQTGQNSALSQRILNELSAAKLCLLDAEKKAAYDRLLQAKISPAAPAAESQGERQPQAPVLRPPVLPVPPAPVSAPHSVVGSRAAHSKSAWQQPAALAAVAGAGLLCGAAIYFLSAEPEAEVVEANAAKPVAVEVGNAPPPSPNTAQPVATKRVNTRAVASLERPAKKVDSRPQPPAPQPPAPRPAPISAPATADFEILEALWGANGKQANVTAAVRQKVKDNRLITMVWSNLFGSPEDPAQGVEKNLRIRYRARGREYLVELPDYYFVYLDGNPLAPPTDSPDALELLEARYGAGDGYLDVTAEARKLVREGRFSAEVNAFYQPTAFPEGWDADRWSGVYKVLWVRYRNATGEHFTYAWNNQTLTIDCRRPQTAGAAIDLLKLIDAKRDAVEGAWLLDAQGLAAPPGRFDRLQISTNLPDEYALTAVVEAERELRDVSFGLLVGGRQVQCCLDGYDGLRSGLNLVNGAWLEEERNPTFTWRLARRLEQGRANTLTFLVRKNGVRVLRDGAEVVRWSGDPQTLSLSPNYRVRDPRSLFVQTFDAPFRVTKLELAPLLVDLSGADSLSANSLPANSLPADSLPADSSRGGLLKIFEDEPNFVSAFTSGEGKIDWLRNESYTGSSSVKVSGKQRYTERLPGLDVKIRKQPQAPDEYRFLRFAWKKRGGEQIFLQLHYPINWFRYSAGPYQGQGIGPSIRVANELPLEFVEVTRDLAADFGEFTLKGLALSPADGDCAWFDHIYLAQRLEDFDRIATGNPGQAAGSENRPRNLGDLLPGKRTPQPPDETAAKQARQELHKSFAAEFAAAKTPPEKRQLAEKLIKRAYVSEENASVYAMLREAAALAEAAGDFDLACKAADDLAARFAVDAVALQQPWLVEAGKGAKSPQQARFLADDACRLIAAALAAGQPEAVKRLAAQAQSFAKRTKDAAFIKQVGLRTRDALKRAAEFDAAAAARETLKSRPDDAHAQFTLGRYEAAAGLWSEALPKLAAGSDAAWQKAAQADLALDRRAATADEQIAAGDAWWSLAADEGWPGGHHLRLRAARWYRRAWPSMAEAYKTHVVSRLSSILAADDGLPVWDLFDIPAEQKRGGCVRLVDRNDLRTFFAYEGPIDVSFVARTDGFNVRLFAHEHEAVIWNWELNPKDLRITRPTGDATGAEFTPLEANRWYAFRYVVTPEGTTISVDGATVFAEQCEYGEVPSSPVGVYGAEGSVVDVKNLVIKPLDY